MLFLHSLRTIKQKREHKEGGKKAFIGSLSQPSLWVILVKQGNRDIWCWADWVLWDPGVRYLVCETHSHLQDWISSFSVLLVGLSCIDYVSVPFHLLQCTFLVQYEFGDSFVVLAKREKGSKPKHLLWQKYNLVCARAWRSLLLSLFEYQFCKGFGTGATAPRIHESEPNLTSPSRGNAPYARSTDAGPLLRGQKGALPWPSLRGGNVSQGVSELLRAHQRKDSNLLQSCLFFLLITKAWVCLFLQCWFGDSEFKAVPHLACERDFKQLSRNSKDSLTWERWAEGWEYWLADIFKGVVKRDKDWQTNMGGGSHCIENKGL